MPPLPLSFPCVQGGGWCYSLADCYGRSKTSLGSSSNIPATVNLGGLLSSTCADSPLCNYNMVRLRFTARRALPR